MQLNGSRKVIGVLRGYDVFLNIVLDDAVEERDGGEKVHIGTVVIRGNSVVMLEVTSPRRTHRDGWDEIGADDYSRGIGFGAGKLDGRHGGEGMHGVIIVLRVFLWSLAPANMPCFIRSVCYSLLPSHHTSARCLHCHNSSYRPVVRSPHLLIEVLLRDLKILLPSAPIQPSPNLVRGTYMRRWRVGQLRSHHQSCSIQTREGA